MSLGEESVSLTKGSRYRIESMETREKPLLTHGVFKGYATIGPDDAIVMELDESHKDMAGRIRLIPCHMIIAIDVVQAVEEEKKPEKPQTMYG
jgi:hypothetical protein